jgi:hypothetical protein
MAEGKKVLGEELQVFNAGIEAHGVNTNASKAMNEVDVGNGFAIWISILIVEEVDDEYRFNWCRSDCSFFIGKN